MLPGRPSPATNIRPIALGSIPVQQSLLRRSYVDYETFTIIVRADKAIRIERSHTFWYNGSLRRMAGVRGHGAGALFGRMYGSNRTVSALKTACVSGLEPLEE